MPEGGASSSPCHWLPCLPRVSRNSRQRCAARSLHCWGVGWSGGASLCSWKAVRPWCRGHMPPRLSCYCSMESSGEQRVGASQSRRSSGGDGPYSLSCERVLTPHSTKLGNFLYSFLFFFVATPRGLQDLSGGSVVKNSPANAGDAGLIPESGRSHEEGSGYSLQCSCLGQRSLAGCSP